MIQGFNWGVLLIDIVTLAAWPVLSIIGLLGLRRRQLGATAQAIWAVLIVAVPIMGAVAFWLVQPGDKAASEGLHG